MTAVGGPNVTAVGGPNVTAVGGAGGVSANAPIISADSQVIIYDKTDFFADNGVDTIQALSSIPNVDPDLVPVGQAYQVSLKESSRDRFISFFYLQRDVPSGYEHTLGLYFLADGAERWEIIEGSESFIENLIVADLKMIDGTYAIMSTILAPVLDPGWNLLTYSLPDIRCLGTSPCLMGPESENLIACPVVNFPAGTQLQIAQVTNLEKGVSQIQEPQDNSEPITYLRPGTTYWVKVDQSFQPRFAPPQRLPNGDVPCIPEALKRTETPPPFIPEASLKAGVYMSFENGGALPNSNIDFSDEDILKYDPDSGEWSLFFDGSGVGIGDSDIDAFHLLNDCSILFSLNQEGPVPGISSEIEKEDLILFRPMSSCDMNSGTFERVWKGSRFDVDDDNIDALVILNDGNLVMSTRDNNEIDSAKNEDLIRFFPSNQTLESGITRGEWDENLYFDGSDLRLNGNRIDSDLKGLSIIDDDFYFTLRDRDDVFICRNVTTGTSTRCEGGTTVSIFLDGKEGADQVDHDIDGLHVVLP